MDKKAALAAMAALGQGTRLDVFRLLVQAGDEGIASGEIASRLGAVQNTMSAHLKVLDHAGLVRANAMAGPYAMSPTCSVSATCWPS